MATVKCNCGEVQFCFPISKVPRVHSLCCCDDCQSRIQHLAQKGGTPLDTNNAIEVANFEGQILFTKGRDKLTFYRLTQETNQINVASACCHSFLCARNTDFHGNAVATLPQYAQVDFDAKPMEFLSFRKFWPHKNALQNEPEGLSEFWRIEGGFDGTEGFADAIGAAMGANAAALSEKVDGAITFDELIEGQTIVNVSA